MYQFNWSPVIGDPTPIGWLTVGLYFLTAYFCWNLAVQLKAVSGTIAKERMTWYIFALLFYLLGINKQLDLQTALTELGRLVAHAQGWYEYRRLVQLAFILIVATCCVAAMLVLSMLARRTHVGVSVALIGLTLLFSFVLVRAASFHHIDEFIGRKVFGLRWNWILEIGGILVVLLGNRIRYISIASARRALD